MVQLSKTGSQSQETSRELCRNMQKAMLRGYADAPSVLGGMEQLSKEAVTLSQHDQE